MTDFLSNLPAYGARCPTCTQFAKVYRRKLNSGMVRCLIWLVTNGPKYADANGWIDVPKTAPRHVLASAGELAKLVYWGLAETKFNEDTKKRMSGMWRATSDGRAFAIHGCKVPSHALIYDGVLKLLEGKPIDIREALGEHFDYAELMGEHSHV